MSAPLVLAVSPHLDDAAFSAGGTLALLARRGARVVVMTVFTASVPDPKGFALACQLDKGLDATVDYLALRRGEDSLAQRALGTEPLHLPLREAPHRGYDSAAALFGPVAAGDGDAPRAVLDALDRATLGWQVDAVFGPQALGDHVDHRHVRAAVQVYADSRGLSLALWRDTPYALREDCAIEVPESYVALDNAALDAKVTACAAYASQLGFQFGGPEPMAQALRDMAAAEAARSSRTNAVVEAFSGTLPPGLGVG